MQTSVIDKRTLANGTVLSIIDNSKKIAGDRWQVKITCEAEIPLSESMMVGKRDEDRGFVKQVVNKMEGKVVFSLVKERNFVDDGEKEDVLNDLTSQLFDHILEYLGKPSFPQKLFARRYEELRAICMVEQNRPEREEVEEEDGPVDFSACFKD